MNFLVADGEEAGQEVFHALCMLFLDSKPRALVLQYNSGYGKRPVYVLNSHTSPSWWAELANFPGRLLYCPPFPCWGRGSSNGCRKAILGAKTAHKASAVIARRANPRPVSA